MSSRKFTEDWFRETSRPSIAPSLRSKSERQRVTGGRLPSVVDVQRFPSGRHFASWIGLTARETASAGRRRLGRISKQGDVYLRTLLIHRARSALIAAHLARRRERPLHRLQEWALACEKRRGRNRAAVALANRLARIVWATWKYQRAFDGNWATGAA
jgi:transposase